MCERPLATAAALLVLIEAAAAAAGNPVPLLSMIVLGVAPGLALAPLMPQAARASVVALLAAAPIFGMAAMGVALVSAASIGLPIDAWTPRVIAAALVVTGLLLSGEREHEPLEPRALALEATGLALAVLAGVALQARVIGDLPVPGNDWGKYLLYADEIKRQGSLLIDNPFWMGGVPFREDPGTPALYGAFLQLSGQSTAVLAQGIWAFAVLQILGAFVLGRALLGPAAGVLAALFIAVSPISHDILAWHGLANLAALCLLALLAVYLSQLVTSGLDWRAAAGVAIVLLAIAAAHRLSFGVAVGTVALTVAAGLMLGSSERILRGVARAGLALVLLSAGVVYDLVTRGRTFGGTQEAEAYLSAKADLWLAAQDISLVLSALGLASVAWALWRVREQLQLAASLCLFLVTMALTFAWVVDVPLAYFRMAYYLPVALAPLAAAALVSWLGMRRGVVAGLAAGAVIFVVAWPQARDVRDFYAFANEASLRGLDAVASDLEDNEVVVTDRCWSFLSTWLLHTRTLAALEPEDIQPKAELAPARDAREILGATPRGRARARQLGVRYLLVAPTCTDAREKPARPPVAGTPVFVSERLAILRLAPGQRSGSDAGAAGDSESGSGQASSEEDRD